ncbi:MAG: ABC transporter ATP-binding protein [Hyphomicrobiales bacterium]
MSLEVKSLSFHYGKKQVLNSINVVGVKPGQLTALIGPNAAGKSTFFKSISGLLKPSHGTVELNGVDLASLPYADQVRRVCYMPQFFSANASLTVFDVILLARKNLSQWSVKADDVEAVSTLLVSLGIDALSQTYVSDLSGGQQQMVSIAQALIREPEVFLFDEPTSALDLKRQLEIMSAIKKAAIDRNIICMVALHDLNLAARFADNILLLQNGTLAADGSPNQVLASAAVEETYGVKVEIIQSSEGQIHVSAYL